MTLEPWSTEENPEKTDENDGGHRVQRQGAQNTRRIGLKKSGERPLAFTSGC